jgi:NitT/TauT family transport system substrate-binding protein
MSNSLLHLIRNAIMGACAMLLLAQGPAAAADDVLSVYLGAHTPPLMNALNLIAAGAGFYKDEHLNVTTYRVPTANAAALTCAHGPGNICPMGIEEAIAGYPRGDFLKMFLTRASKFGYVIAVLDSSPVKTLAEVKGKIIGVHSLSGDVSNFGGALASVGLKPGDYTLVPIGMEDAAINQLTSGKVQVVALPLYELIPYLVGGLKLRIFHNPTLEDAANAGYLASPATLTAKHNDVARFSRAIVKAALLVRTQPEVAARDLLKANGAPFTEADVQRKMAEFAVWQNFLPAADPASHRIGTPSVAGMGTYLKILKGAGILKFDVPVSAVVTDEFSAAANDFDHKTIENMTK